MKKTLNITIGGRVFAIEEDAFERLNTYLEQVKNIFKTYSDPEEIIADMEDRLAEQFQSMHDKNSIHVITIQNVESVIAIMGTPEDIEYETDKEESSASEARKETKKDGSRRLYRNSDDKIIFGVCSGIAAYFNIDTIWARIAFIIFSLLPLPAPFLPGILLYIALAIIIPEAKTTTEKMEMRGKAITVAGIVNTMKQEFTEEKNKERISKIKNLASDVGGSAHTTFERIKPKAESVLKRAIRFPFELIINILRFTKNKIFPIIIRIFGVFVFLGTVSGLFIITSILFILIFNLNSPYLDFPIHDFISGPFYYFLSIFAYTIFLIPLILTTLLALTMLRYKNSFSKTFTISLISAWIIIGVFGGAILISRLPDTIFKIKQHPFFKETIVNYPLKNFTKLSVNGPYSIAIKQGTTYEVKVTATGGSLQEMNVEQKNDTLIIDRIARNKPCVLWCITPHAQIEITMPDLQAISNRIKDNDLEWYGNRGTMSLYKMDLKSLKLDLIHQYVLLNETTVKNLDATIQNSFIRGSGQVKNVKLVSNFGEWWGDEIKTDMVEADLANSSRALFSTKQLTITATKGNQIYYTGHPKIVSHIDPGTILEPYDEYLKNQTGWQNSEETIDLNRLNSSEPSLDPNLSQE